MIDYLWGRPAEVFLAAITRKEFGAALNTEKEALSHIIGIYFGGPVLLSVGPAELRPAAAYGKAPAKGRLLAVRGVRVRALAPPPHGGEPP